MPQPLRTFGRTSRKGDAKAANVAAPHGRDVTTVLVTVAVAAGAAATTALAGAGARDEPSNQQRTARIELGRRLFFDPAASRSGRVSCADCHQPERGFSDPRPHSQDEFEATRRHSQGVADL